MATCGRHAPAQFATRLDATACLTYLRFFWFPPTKTYTDSAAAFVVIAGCRSLDIPQFLRLPARSLTVQDILPYGNGLPLPAAPQRTGSAPCRCLALTFGDAAPYHTLYYGQFDYTRFPGCNMPAYGFAVAVQFTTVPDCANARFVTFVLARVY